MDDNEGISRGSTRVMGLGTSSARTHMHHADVSWSHYEPFYPFNEVWDIPVPVHVGFQAFSVNEKS